MFPSSGLTIPAILGAKLARPDLPMVGFCGDGSTLMRLGELELFSRLNVAVPLVCPPLPPPVVIICLLVS